MCSQGKSDSLGRVLRATPERAEEIATCRPDAQHWGMEIRG
jgi:hypothetical protein